MHANLFGDEPARQMFWAWCNLWASMQVFYGTCARFLWHMCPFFHGTCARFLWHMCPFFMAHVPVFHGTCARFLWHMCPFFMAHVPVFHGTCARFLWQVCPRFLWASVSIFVSTFFRGNTSDREANIPCNNYFI